MEQMTVHLEHVCILSSPATWVPTRCARGQQPNRAQVWPVMACLWPLPAGQCSGAGVLTGRPGNGHDPPPKTPTPSAGDGTPNGTPTPHFGTHHAHKRVCTHANRCGAQLAPHALLHTHPLDCHLAAPPLPSPPLRTGTAPRSAPLLPCLCGSGHPQGHPSPCCRQGGARDAPHHACIRGSSCHGPCRRRRGRCQPQGAGEADAARLNQRRSPAGGPAGRPSASGGVRDTLRAAAATSVVWCRWDPPCVRAWRCAVPVPFSSAHNGAGVAPLCTARVWAGRAESLPCGGLQS